MHATAAQHLTTGPLSLGTYATADLDHLVNLCNEPDVVAYTTVPHPYTHADAHAFLENEQNKPSDLVWAIRHDKHGYIGSIAALLLDEPTPHIGYMLLPEHRGHGHIPAAVHAVCEWLAKNNYSSCALNIMPENIASKAVAQKTGFQHLHTTVGADTRFEKPVDIEYWERNLDN